MARSSVFSVLLRLPCSCTRVVATGRTLVENGLIAIEDLFHSTARLVGHPLALRLDSGELQAIVDQIAAVSAAPVPAAARCMVSGSQNHAISVATIVTAAAAHTGAA